MRLVKVCNVLINLDNIAVIRTNNTQGKPKVYAYTTGGEEIFLGTCENMEDYQGFVDTLYEIVDDSWPSEVTDETIDDDEDKELWG